ANFNPHCHAIISDGVWTREGEFLELPSLDTTAVCELFRRLLLLGLHQPQRLSQGFMENLLSWVHPGFSVFAGEPLSPRAPEQLERLARYITRPRLPPIASAVMKDRSRLRHVPIPAPARPTASSILWTGSTPSWPTFRIAAVIACATMGRLPIATIAARLLR